MRATVATVVTGTLLFIAARMAPLTFLSLHFAGAVGIPLSIVGLAFLTENLARAATSPVAGTLSDRFGRKPVLVATGIASAVAMPLFLLVTDVWTLFAWSLLLGVAQGGWFPVSLSLLLDLAPDGRRQSTLALNYTAASIGYTFAVVPAGFLVAFGFGALAALSSGAFLLLALVVAFLPRPGRRSAQADMPTWRDLVVPFRDRRFLTLAVPGTVFPIGLGLVTIAMPFYAAGVGVATATVGIILGGSGVGLALTAYPVSRALERRGPAAQLPAAALVGGAGLALFAWAGAYGWWPLAAGILLFTLCEAVFSSALPTAVGHLAPVERRGSYQGAWGMAFAATVGGALWLASVLRDLVGWVGAWWILAGVMAVAAVPLARHARSVRSLAART